MPAMSKQPDYMNELMKIALDFLKKQAGLVLVLLVACWGLIQIVLEQKKELIAQITAANPGNQEELRRVMDRLDACEAARERLIVEVEVLKVQIEVLQKKGK